MTAPHLPPPKRGPRFGDLVYIRGIAMPIEGLPLYQPDAPKAYLVESPLDVPHRVAWDGLRWATEQSLDEAHGGHGSLRSLPAEGSIPSSSAPLGIAAKNKLPGRKKQALRGGSSTPDEPGALPLSAADPQSPLSRKRKARRRGDPRGPYRTAKEPTQTLPTAKPVPYEGSFVAQGRAAVAEAKARDPEKFALGALKDFRLATDKPPTYAHVPPHVRPLHIALDAARDKYQKARTDANAEAYFAAIEAVDKADPGHFLGRVNPMAPLPRYVPPDLDYHGISARMDIGATASEAIERSPLEAIMHCRICGCTDSDCSQCVRKTGVPCYWVEPGLCSACAPETMEVTS